MCAADFIRENELGTEVHPPHGEIHTGKDFLVHLTIITLGLLIALGLEGIVEWARNKPLVHRAEASLKSELRENRTTLADASATGSE